MEGHGPISRIGGGWTSSVLGSRRGALVVSVCAAVLAGILIYAFVSHFKKNTVVPPTMGYAFVASKYIPQGTPASTVAQEGLLRREQVPVAQVVVGAISDPSQLTGEVAASGIAAGQQVTYTDFSHAAVTIASYLTGDQRALALSLDAEHGLTSYLAAGDYVDVMGESGGKTTMLMQNLQVISNQTGDVVLRVTDKQALQLSAAVTSTSVWLALRPTTHARSSVAVGSVGQA